MAIAKSGGGGSTSSTAKKTTAPASTGSPTLDAIAIAQAAKADAAALAAQRAADAAQNKAITQIKNGTIKPATPAANPLPPSNPTPTPQPTPTPIPEPTPQPTPAAIDKSSGLVDGVNFQQQYFDTIKEIVLSLVKSAKGLLGRYNFSTIDRIPEYYLDLDREAASTAVISAPSRPSSPFTPGQADYQDKFSLDVNEINNKISDLSLDVDRSQYFGTLRGDTFTAGEVKIMNGSSYYDMRLVFNSVSSQQNFVIKCYEI